MEVLNINELANSLKPIVLPGEIMSLHPEKGKEYNQGVAYLDDGTMVVVNNARKMIGKNVDVSVTSVLQTTAGKMILESGMSDTAAGSIRTPATMNAVSVLAMAIRKSCTGIGGTAAGISLLRKRSRPG